MEDTETYYVSTPEKIYNNANITGYRINRAPNGTSDMLVVDLTVQEVRTIKASGYVRAQKPSGEKKQNNGTVQPLPDASAGIKT